MNPNAVGKPGACLWKGSCRMGLSKQRALSGNAPASRRLITFAARLGEPAACTAATRRCSQQRHGSAGTVLPAPGHRSSPPMLPPAMLSMPDAHPFAFDSQVNGMLSENQEAEVVLCSHPSCLLRQWLWNTDRLSQGGFGSDICTVGLLAASRGTPAGAPGSPAPFARRRIKAFALRRKSLQSSAVLQGSPSSLQRSVHSFTHAASNGSGLTRSFETLVHAELLGERARSPSSSHLMHAKFGCRLFFTPVVLNHF